MALDGETEADTGFPEASGDAGRVGLQIHPESSKHVKMVSRGSDVWILGLKTEGDHTGLDAVGGAVEICGAFIYAHTRTDQRPLFVIRDCDFSATMGESSFRGRPHHDLVIETRGDETRTLRRGQTPRRGEGSAMGLFVARGRRPVNR